VPRKGSISYARVPSLDLAQWFRKLERILTGKHAQCHRDQRAQQQNHPTHSHKRSEQGNPWSCPGWTKRWHPPSKAERLHAQHAEQSAQSPPQGAAFQSRLAWGRVLPPPSLALPPAKGQGLWDGSDPWFRTWKRREQPNVQARPPNPMVLPREIQSQQPMVLPRVIHLNDPMVPPRVPYHPGPLLQADEEQPGQPQPGQAWPPTALPLRHPPLGVEPHQPASSARCSRSWRKQGRGWLP